MNAPVPAAAAMRAVTVAATVDVMRAVTVAAIRSALTVLELLRVLDGVPRSHECVCGLLNGPDSDEPDPAAVQDAPGPPTAAETTSEGCGRLW